MPSEQVPRQLILYCCVLLEMNKEELKKHYEPLIAEKKARIAQLDAEEHDLREFHENIDDHTRKRDVNKSAVEAQKATHDNLLASIEKERIQQIDKLRKDMLM